MTHAAHATAPSHTALHNDVRATLEETDECYTLMIEAGENPNLDSVGYAATVSLDRFRQILGRPDLDLHALEEILRAARQEVRKLMGPRPYTRVPRPVQTPSPTHNWADLMARCVVARANG